ncbi:MAG: hypothetical protein MK116_06760 [Phycisphaerales bacterium]|nr:hypothetical protein [Phycisphaerales bacterium]
MASLLTLGLIAVLAIVPAQPAQAQLGAVAQAMEPEYFTRDLLIFIEGLDLDETQAVIAEAIFDDYEQRFMDGKQQMEDEIESLTAELQELRGKIDNDKLLEMVVAPIQSWMIRREGLNDQLIENVRVILVPNQQELWTAFARKLYREKKLDEGRLSGERVDLFVVARDVSIDTTEEPVKAVMLNYALALDDALRARQRLMDGDNKDLLNVLRNRQDDPNADLGNRKKIEEARVIVRNVNDSYREEIAAILDEGTAQTFRTEVLRRAYPKIYRLTNAERVFNDALTVYGPEGDKDNAELYDAILGLYSEFLGKLAYLNHNMYEATRTSEPELEMARIDNSLRRVRGEELLRPEDPIRPMQQEKRELEREYIDRLRALLGDDEFGDLNGARRYMPPPKYDPNDPANADKGERLLQLHSPGKSGTLPPKGGKPDGRPDAPPTDLGRGSGVGSGVGNRQPGNDD